jgi:hypothetical protein
MTYTSVTKAAVEDVSAGGDIDLLVKGELSDKGLGLCGSSGPAAVTGDVFGREDNLRGPLLEASRGSVGATSDDVRRGESREGEDESGEAARQHFAGVREENEVEGRDKRARIKVPPWGIKYEPINPCGVSSERRHRTRQNA